MMRLGSAPFSRFVFLGLAATAWIASLAVGFVRLTAYSTRPGVIGDTAILWPNDSTLPAPAGKAELIISLHPQCPCSRATVAELARLMDQCDGVVEVHALILQPSEMKADWAEGSILNSLREMRGVHIHMDPDGAEMKRFGALTSGQIAIYSPAGQRIYVGGITDSRGHEGSNYGESAAVEAIVQGRTPTPTFPVFGCRL